MAENNGFLNQQDIEFDSHSKDSSLKSNILLLFKNFANLAKYLKMQKEFIAYIFSLLNVDELINNILEQLQNSKTILLVDNGMIVGEHIDIESNSVTYRMTRVSPQTIDIINLSNNEWNVDGVVVQIKTIQGQIVYPSIVTNNSKISIQFNDGIDTNYNILLV